MEKSQDRMTPNKNLHRLLDFLPTRAYDIWHRIVCKIFGHSWEDVEIFEHAYGSEYQEICTRCGKSGECFSSHHLFP